jgi:hypothetical protein
VAPIGGHDASDDVMDLGLFVESVLLSCADRE